MYWTSAPLPSTGNTGNMVNQAAPCTPCYGLRPKSSLVAKDAYMWLTRWGGGGAEQAVARVVDSLLPNPGHTSVRLAPLRPSGAPAAYHYTWVQGAEEAEPLRNLYASRKFTRQPLVYYIYM